MPKSQPTWTDVKAKLADFDRAALLGLIQSLYATHKDNQMFLHTRFGLGDDVLEPYKKTIDRWLWPDVLRNQNTSVSQAKRAISEYKKAVGDPEVWRARSVRNHPARWSTPAIRASRFEPTESLNQQSVLTVPSVQFVKAFHRLVKIRFSQALRLAQTASWMEGKSEKIYADAACNRSFRW